MAVAILLVGGFGTRLMPLTKNTPKPMLTVAGVPVTEHQLAMAKAAGITEIVLATSYLSEVFIPYFGDGPKRFLEFTREIIAIARNPITSGRLNTENHLIDFTGVNKSSSSTESRMETVAEVLSGKTVARIDSTNRSIPKRSCDHRGGI